MKPFECIVPRPVQICEGEGNLALSDTVKVAGGSRTAELLVASLQKSQINARLVLDDSADIRLKVDESIPNEEGYRLTVGTSGIELVGASESGLFYGSQTLRQMLSVSRDLPCVVIADHPRFKWRAFMLDSSRHFQSVDTVKWLLDQMALLKLNTLHWHLADDQGWRLEIKRYPKLTEVGSTRHPDEPDANGFYTQDQIRDIVSFAQDRGINIVPEIEFPAHTTAAMAAYPELTCTGEPVAKVGIGLNTFTLDQGSRIYCAAREESLEFIEGVLTEVAELFPSPVIHVGGDERPDGIWSNCPRCKAVMEREGFTEESALQHWFMQKVNQIVLKLGRRSMAWTPTIEHGVPKGQIVHDWFYNLTGPAASQGQDVVNSKDWFTYLDYPNFPGRQKPDWMGELPIERMYEFDPLPAEVPEEMRHHVLGAECSLWTEFIEQDDFCGAIFPRMLVFSEVVWSPLEGRNWDVLKTKIDSLKPWLESLGCRYAFDENKRSIKTTYPCKVECSMEPFAGFTPEWAFTGKFVRAFWSVGAPKAGDHLTVWLDSPQSIKTIKVFTGGEADYGHVLDSGMLEVSEDGLAFETVGPVSGWITELTWSGGPLKAIRLRVTQSQEGRLCIREILVR